ncbi:SDR family oxidoreductase [Duganella callida]|uniref:SDR family oxidoreductase n=1 Tax=Duganella callida TaxID=2561932 RepID=A0A4Y9SGN2_9BURK|nr:SDR family oxidoreductase [Duganella callida]TFW19384.1 SDR family oxidoreductase [Duganella callida]
MSKSLLVIGSGPGIGLATAQRFLKEGYNIVLSSRSISNLQAQAAQLGAGVTLVEADAARPGQIDELVSRLAAAGPLTILYNAGVLRYDAEGNLRPLPLSGHTAGEIQSDMAINLTSAMVAIRAALPAMTARGEGTILLTGGGFGVNPSPDFLPLSVGKAGIRAIAQGLFAPLKEQGIHIGTVTVGRLVSPGSAAAREIAELFWQMNAARPEDWRWEQAFG